MKRLSLVLSLAVLLTLALAGAAGAQSNSVTVTLNAQNGSGQNGTATLTAMGNQTQVVINVSGEPSGASEPDHIHTGTCANLGGVKYPLANVVNGTSTTVVNVPLSTLQSGTYAINLHKSAAQIGVYVACGDIPTSASATTSGAATTTATTPSAAPSTGAGGMATGATAFGLAAVLVAALLLVSWVGRRRAA
jgi:hypothetical protein